MITDAELDYLVEYWAGLFSCRLPFAVRVPWNSWNSAWKWKWKWKLDYYGPTPSRSWSIYLNSRAVLRIEYGLDPGSRMARMGVD